MKRVVTIAAVVVVITVIGWEAVEFAGGYNAFPIVVVFLPASFFLFALTSLTTSAAAIIVLVALVRHRIQYASILAVVIAASWLLSPWFVGRSAFLLGLAARLHQLSSPAEIQSVAQTCLSLMPSGGHAFGPRKVLGPPPDEAEQSKRVWDAVSRYRFAHLDGDTCVISVRTRAVTFEWGGALPGHWGIVVGSPTDDLDFGYYKQTIRFSDGMFLFRGE